MKISFLRRLWVTFSASVVGFYASGLNRFVSKGGENIPPAGGVLVVSNHISAYETIFLPWAIIRQHPFQMVWAPAKEELFQKPFQRLLYSTWGAFPVKRKRDVKAAHVLEDLLQDQKVMLFPEGTRHRDGGLGTGNRGVGKIIYDTRPIVIPTALRFEPLEVSGHRSARRSDFRSTSDFSDRYVREDCKETQLLIVGRLMKAIADLLRKKGLMWEAKTDAP